LPITASDEAYAHAEIEAAAQAAGAPSTYRAVETLAQPKFFCVSMPCIPPASCTWATRNYTINDMMYRQMRMLGHNVLMPMAGTRSACRPRTRRSRPASAREMDVQDIAYMKEQCKAMGWAIDWSREIATRSGVLQVEPVVLPQDARKGYRVQEDRRGQLGRSDRARQRTGDDGCGWRTGAPVEKREILPTSRESPITPRNCSRISTACPVGPNA
jgi:leucyl-tRNA synthetase